MVEDEKISQTICASCNSNGALRNKCTIYDGSSFSRLHPLIPTEEERPGTPFSLVLLTLSMQSPREIVVLLILKWGWSMWFQPVLSYSNWSLMKIMHASHSIANIFICISSSDFQNFSVLHAICLKKILKTHLFKIFTFVSLQTNQHSRFLLKEKRREKNIRRMTSVL